MADRLPGEEELATCGRLHAPRNCPPTTRGLHARQSSLAACSRPWRWHACATHRPALAVKPRASTLKQAKLNSAPAEAKPAMQDGRSTAIRTIPSIHQLLRNARQPPDMAPTWGACQVQSGAAASDGAVTAAVTGPKHGDQGKNLQGWCHLTNIFCLVPSYGWHDLN